MKSEIVSTSISRFRQTHIFELLGTLTVALLLWYVWRKFKPPPPSSPNESESDGFARSLINDVAREVARARNSSGEELAQALWNCRVGKPTGDVLIAPLRVECTLTKVAANRIGVCVQMLCQEDGRAAIISLKRDYSWDELPREIRSEFIKTGQPEQHYVLCELGQNNQNKTNS
jgi:hypothetical protein